MKVMMNDDLLTLKEAQRILSVSKRTLLHMIKCGELITDPSGRRVTRKSCYFHVYSGPTVSMGEHLDTLVSHNVTDQEREMIADWT